VSEDLKDADGKTLRPLTWEPFIGQEALTSRLRTKGKAAFELERPHDHPLITGPTGTGSGKTTLAHLVTEETGDIVEVISRPVDERGLMQALWALPANGGALFIDETSPTPPRDPSS